MKTEELNLPPAMECIADIPAIRCTNCGTNIGFSEQTTMKEIEIAIRLHKCPDQK